MGNNVPRYRNHYDNRDRLSTSGGTHDRNVDSLWPDGEPMTYHPGYGLAFDMHEQVVAYAIEHGIKAASQHYNIGVSTIYRWRYNLRR